MKLLLTFSVLVSYISSFAQTVVGVKAGPNLAGIIIDAPVDKKGVIKYHAGATFQTKLSEKFLIQPELLYSVKGFEAPSPLFAENDHVSLGYVSLPILLGYQVLKQLHVSAGPEFDFLVNSTTKTGTLVTHPDRYNKLDFGVDLSAAVMITKRIGTEFLYNFGLRNLGNVIERQSDYSATSNVKTANRVLQLSIVYQFTK